MHSLVGHVLLLIDDSQLPGEVALRVDARLSQNNIDELKIKAYWPRAGQFFFKTAEIRNES